MNINKLQPFISQRECLVGEYESYQSQDWTVESLTDAGRIPTLRLVISKERPSAYLSNFEFILRMPESHLSCLQASGQI